MTRRTTRSEARRFWLNHVAEWLSTEAGEILDGQVTGVLPDDLSEEEKTDYACAYEDVDLMLRHLRLFVSGSTE